MANLSPAAKARQVAAQRAWQAANYERLTMSMPIGKKDEYKAFAARVGKSLTSLICELLDAEMLDN